MRGAGKKKTDQRQKTISRELGQTKTSKESITKTDLVMAFGRTQSWGDLAKILLFFINSEALYGTIVLERSEHSKTKLILNIA